MLLTATTDNLEVILDKAITTSQLSFSVYFAEYTSTTVTPTENTGTTNSTTAVNLVAAPASGAQRQLKWCSINNIDTADIGVKIRFNDNGSFRNVLYVFLRVNESIQYSEEMGWRVYDSTGAEKGTGAIKQNNSVIIPEQFGAASTGSAMTLGSTNAYCMYLGRADRPYSSVSIRYGVTSGISGTTWAELAIYRGTPTLGSGLTMTRLGFTDTSAVWNSTGNKTTAVACTGMAIGDDLWAVFSNSATGATQLRAGLVDSQLITGRFQSVVNSRPSTNSTLTTTVDSSTAMIWLAWQGTPQGT